MFIQILLAIIFGILCGTFTGLVPGLHTNLLSIILLGLYPFFSGVVSGTSFCIIIVSLAISQLFIAFIPSVFLGAPSPENIFGALPGHRMLLMGKGLLAVKIMAFACFFSLFMCILIIPFVFFLIQGIFNYFKSSVPFILIAVSAIMILREKGLRARIWAGIVFIFSGILGLIALNSDISQPLFPMLSGLFGVGMLIASALSDSEIPFQEEEGIFEGRNFLMCIAAAVFSGSFVCLFPALGPSQAAAIGSELVEENDENYLAITGGISSVNIMISIVFLLAIGKARNGAIAVLGRIANLNYGLVIALSICALVSAAIALFSTIIISRKFALIIPRINYKKLCAAMIAFMLIMSFILSGFAGIILLFAASSIGLIPNLLGIRRAHAMGALIIPVIGYYLF
ncbi:MAG: tripartite tricarboxylate transporter permease [Candidatus Woesearchaeota archaeon]|nr:tripartite tricarboxylate transporter permease [Candidatus Woesearchaeota archaeon]